MVKQRTALTLDPEIIKKAKEAGLNMSEIAEVALERELSLETSKAYMKGLEAQLASMKSFLLDFDMLQKFEDWKFASKEEKEVLKKQHENTTINEVFGTATNSDPNSLGSLSAADTAKLDDSTITKGL